ncbi:MAG: hypothetical protein KH100_09815 [Dysgonomonas mossii]|uniref:hypothetical protein n=1 Tax=Dysgonomonas mossii TaxID=163665 RepID=UPI001D299799|nr:hypothetical protein [Dysgonomonas mossii]MBS5797601.1 hypothetical protein [Dysgonomonas mossii]MBS7111480.1 hypothetical protein [Dysgonomonas mossii]
MSDLSTISVMFEELKQILKRVEFNSTKPESSIKQDVISASDLENITNQVSQSEELIIQKLEQIEQAQTAPKKMYHRISIDITSSWVFITIMVIGLMLLVSLFFHYRQREVINNLSDNDLKYRYIKAFNKADSVSVYKLEDVFEYNRDSKVIKEIRQSVEKYEQDVIDKARRMEQAKLKEEEAERLQNEAGKLKSE